MPLELYLPGLQGFVIDAQILDSRPLEVEAEGAVGLEGAQVEREVDYSLVGVSL